jgi:ribosomal protein L15
MRGQKARSGAGTRPGFEGGQIPLYRRLPKLKGIAGGMGAGQPDNVIINLKTLAEKFSEGEEVSLSGLKHKNILNLSGREARLGLKVLGDGDLPFPLTIKAACFSASALSKIESAGGTAEVIPTRQKWSRKAHEKQVASGKSKAKVTKAKAGEEGKARPKLPKWAGGAPNPRQVKKAKVALALGKTKAKVAPGKTKARVKAEVKGRPKPKWAGRRPNSGQEEKAKADQSSRAEQT